MAQKLTYILSILFFLSTGLKSQIICVDLTPDSIVSNNKTYFLDLNGDGLYDFRFLHEDQQSGLNGNGLGLACMHDNVEFLGNLPSGDPTHYYPYKLNKNVLVDYSANGEQWVTKHPDPDVVRVLNLQYDNNTYAGGSQWIWGVVDCYLGVRLRGSVDEEWHYGWVKLDVTADATLMRVKAYAYNSVLKQGILTGEGETVYANVVSDLNASDVFDYGDGRDLLIGFTKAENESQIREYRLFVVKSGFKDSFSLDDANQADSLVYHKLGKTGANQSFSLESTAVDINGDLICENESYVVFILSVGNETNNVLNALSSPSNEITLSNTSAVSEEDEDAGIQILQDRKQLWIYSDNQEEKQLTLYSITGQVLLKETFYSEYQLGIDSLLPYGIYMLVITNKHQLLLSKKLLL